jgi:DNA end-binding protein Ku
MTNPIWNGHISFGLVNIPISLYSAEKRSEIRFHLLDSRNKAKIHYERINDETGQEVPWNKIVKAFEYDKKNYVVLDQEDFKRAAPEATKSIDIENFVRLSEIEPIYFERPYLLVPEKAGEKGYVLLREVLQKTKKVAVAKVVLRERQYLAILMPIDNALMINLIRFKQELRSFTEFHLPEENIKAYKISSQELKMAEQLVESMTSRWKPEQYHDDYREALMQWIEQKATHKKSPRKTKVKEELPDNVMDFMAALKKSLQKTKKTSTKSSHVMTQKKRKG